jgi:glycosyltransferase involved in cell wall biosynthesis
MRISIAMATYNGAKYLQAQLDSFAAQTQLPDELIVCDDNSTDQTLEILENFAQSAAFTVRIHRNQTRLGYVENFNRAMLMCDGDIVFLSDQDDYWLPSKIQCVYAIFQEHPNTWMVINDAEITDESLQPTGLTILGQIKSAGLNSDEHNNGCCSAYRRNIQPVFLPIPAATYPHDSWLHLIGLSLACRQVITLRLQYYRRHGQNTSGHITSNTSPASPFKLLRKELTSRNLRQDPVEACEKRLMQLAIFRERLEQNSIFLMSNLPSPCVLEKTLSHIALKTRANLARKAILMKRPPARIFLALHFYWVGGYRNFEGFKSLAKDVLL